MLLQRLISPRVPANRSFTTSEDPTRIYIAAYKLYGTPNHLCTIVSNLPWACNHGIHLQTPARRGKLGTRDIHLEDVTVSNGGQDLIEGGTLTLANGRRYGLVGRNGTGKSTLLRALAVHQIKGLPSNC